MKWSPVSTALFITILAMPCYLAFAVYQAYEWEQVYRGQAPRAVYGFQFVTNLIASFALCFVLSLGLVIASRALNRLLQKILSLS